MKWTSNLEKCQAQALNPTAVSEFYDILEELIDEYKITEENIYNMDEKGIQLGMGKHVCAFMNRDQQSITQVEDGDWELVTLIECVCADGTATQPRAVFKGAILSRAVKIHAMPGKHALFALNSDIQLMTVTAFQPHQRDGLTKNWGLHGWNMISTQ